MMKGAAFLLLLMCCIGITAQNSNLDYGTAIKIYNISTLQVMRHGAYFGTYNAMAYDLQIMHPALAVQWRNRKYNFHEVELTRLMANKNYNAYDVGLPAGGFEAGGSRNITHIALRYEYILCFAKKRDSRLVPSLAFGLAPSFYRHSFNPENTVNYYLSTTSLALEGLVIPRLNYHLNSRFYLDMNIPVSVLGFDMTTSTNRNPQIPLRQQKLSNFDFSFLGSFYSLRLGLGFKF